MTHPTPSHLVELAERPSAGWYLAGKTRWHVVFRENGDAICNSDDGEWYTAANAETFRRWGWVREDQARAATEGRE